MERKARRNKARPRRWPCGYPPAADGRGRLFSASGAQAGASIGAGPGRLTASLNPWTQGFGHGPYSAQTPHHPKTVVSVGVRRCVPVPVRGAGVPGIVVPGPAAHHTRTLWLLPTGSVPVMACLVVRQSCRPWGADDSATTSGELDELLTTGALRSAAVMPSVGSR